MHTGCASRRLITGIALLASLEVVASSASAQSGMLTGAVLSDPGERPIRGAEISIRALGLSARTDSAGQFTIPRVARGQHVVMVRALGFAPVESRISFAGGQRGWIRARSRPLSSIPFRRLPSSSITPARGPAGRC
jgi:hypothetical protein